MKKTMLIKERSVVDFFDNFIKSVEKVPFDKKGTIIHSYNMLADDRKASDIGEIDRKTITFTNKMFVKRESGLKVNDTITIIVSDKLQRTHIDYTVEYTYSVKEYDHCLLEINLDFIKITQDGTFTLK